MSRSSRTVFTAWAAVCVLGGLAGCSDDGTGGGNLADGAPSTSGGSDATAPDASGDAPDASSVPIADAAAEAGTTPDTMADAAGPQLNVVYATFNGVLLRIDPATGVAKDVGILRNKANETEVFRDVVMHWSGAGDTALMILNYAAPVLGTADLCTGLVTKGVAMTRTATPNLVAEGLARHPDGTWFGTGGQAPNPNNPISTHVGKLDPATGVLTDLGAAVASYQDDGDMLFFRGTTLFGADVATTVNRLDMFNVDLTTGAVTAVMAPTYASNLVPLRVAYDESRGKAFAWRAGDRNLVEFSLTGNLVTPIGPTHAAGAYNNQPIRGFFVGPPPRCP